MGRTVFTRPNSQEDLNARFSSILIIFCLSGSFTKNVCSRNWKYLTPSSSSNVLHKVEYMLFVFPSSLVILYHERLIKPFIHNTIKQSILLVFIFEKNKTVLLQ